MIFSNKWHWLPFIGFQVLGLILLWSYLNDTSFQIWRSFDEMFFTFINSSLSNEAGLWETFWAYSSTRIWDLASAFLILAFYAFNKESNQARRNLLGFIVVLSLLLLFRESIFSFVNDFIGKVKSPSLVLPDVVRLSEIFPLMDLKDKSKTSFPGDHATVTILWCWIMWRQKSVLWIKVAACALTLLLVSPRLISGAHWLTDIIVGGGTLALIVGAWSFYTPVASKILEFFLPYFERTTLWFGKITGLRYILPFFRG